jgi:hypothetical protein
MATTDFDRVVNLVKTWDEQEQLRLRDLLDSWLGLPGPPPTEEELAAEMLREGILDHVPPPITDTTPWDNRKPLDIEGEPLSETIIRERR